MRTETEIIKQIHDVEKDITIMSATPAQVAWEYYVKALKWVLREKETRDGTHAETMVIHYRTTVLK